METKSVLAGSYQAFPGVKKPGLLYTSTSRVLECKPYLDLKTAELFNEVRLLYDALVKIMFNYRQSGHPGGAISVGPQLIGLFLEALRYDISQPDNVNNDVAGLASGHKANGLYALLTLIFEAVKQREPSALPKDAILFKDLLGFRRNRTYHSRLVDQLKPTRLDGHPTPDTPFVRIASGASGYAISQFLGLALNLRERFIGDRPPLVYILEGADGGATTGRYQEAYQAAHNMRLGNVIFLGDFNNANIDENLVACKMDDSHLQEGNLVSWAPEELAATHGGNVVTVNDGHDFHQVIASFNILNDLLLQNNRFTVGVFHTIKSCGYDPACGVVGRKYHGAGHEIDSPEYFAAQAEFEKYFNLKFPRLPENKNQDTIEEYFLKSLELIREILIEKKVLTDFMVERIMRAKDRIPRNRKRAATDITPLMEENSENALAIVPPPELVVLPGKASYRKQYVKIVGYLDQITKGAFWAVSADLLSSTLPDITKYLGGKGAGYTYLCEEYYYGEKNRDSRILHGGGITEDVNAGLLLGLGAQGLYTGVSTSYGAFQSLAHTHVRVSTGPAGSPERMQRVPIQIGAFHASLWTGPDGVRTHADPQALSVWRENFPYGSVITMVPIDPNEIYPMLIAAYRARPNVIVPFIARPDGVAFDRERLGFASPLQAAKGGYILKPAKPGKVHATVVLQGAGVAKIFIEKVLPRLEEKWNISLVVITSHELFRMQTPEYREMVLPFIDADKTRRNSIAITEFNEGTIRPYVDEMGLRYSLFSYKPASQLGKDADERESCGPYGSGEPDEIFVEAGLEAESQLKAVNRYLEKIN